MAIFRFFYNLYVNVYKWYTLFLINKATKAAAKLMVMSGKNPNYVPPPPLPPPQPTIADALTTRHGVSHPTTLPPSFSSIGAPWVKNPKDHPILQSRRQFEEKQAKAAAQKAIREAEAKAAEVAKQAADITEVGKEAIDSLREAVHNIEEAVIEEKKAS